MSKNEKARAGIAVPAQAVENGSVCETAQPSTQDFTTAVGGRQPFRVSDLLLRGEENALPMKHLKAVTDLSSREIRAMIQHERLMGTPICANNQTGYYLPGDSAERDRCVKSMRHRAGEILKSADAIEGAVISD